MEKKKISIMTACFNEEGNLKELYERTIAILNTMSQYEFEWVFIDNDSSDRSREVLSSIADEDPRIKVIYNLRNFGPGRSSCHGLFQTTGDAAICMACDLQDPPELIPKYIERWEEGSDVVLGRIALSEEPQRSFAARGLFYKIMAFFSDNPIESHVTGFGLYSRRVIDLLKAEANPVPNFRFSVANFGFDISYVDYDQPMRKIGQSSYNFARKLETSIASLTQISTKPIRLITIAGSILSAVSAFVVVVAVIKLLLNPSIHSWGFLLCSLICMLAGFLALAIGVVGEYVALVLLYEKREPLVFEGKRLNFEKSGGDPWIVSAMERE